jgi:hypothetical protein
MNETYFEPHHPPGGEHEHHHDKHEHEHHKGHGHEPCCFLEGTRLQTPHGLKKVEDLAAGDEVCTVEHGVQRLRWVGRSTIHADYVEPLFVQPICIAAGALGEATPARDLWVSPDHALFLDGILVQAGALVNGVNIYRAQHMPERFTYYHMELEAHELLLAEGVPAESFVDNVGRWAFDNAAEYEALGPASIAEMQYPRAKSARQVPAGLKQRLAARQELRKTA